jgi:Fe-S-cluster containining protein
LHPGCGYRDWQRAALHLIQSDVGGEILQKLREINRDRDKVKCHSSGVCCRLASSEFSWEELCEKAAAGDRFAGEFTSIFLPYADAEAARARFPDIVDDVLRYGRDPMGAPEGSINAAPVYFYHCPYIGEDNRCSVYGTPKRPDICATYPDTPLTFMYKKCAWKPWQERSHDEALLAHAMIELGSFLVDKLTQALAEDA